MACKIRWRIASLRGRTTRPITPSRVRRLLGEKTYRAWSRSICRDGRGWGYSDSTANPKAKYIEGERV